MTVQTHHDAPEPEVDDLPNVFAVLREVFDRTRDADWEHYILDLPRPIDPNDAVRNDVLEAILSSLEVIRSLTGWDTGVALLLAGCKSTVDDLPAERAPTSVLQKVSNRLNRVHRVVGDAAVALENLDDVHPSDPATLVRRLMAWGPTIDQTPFVAMMRRDWVSAAERSASAVEAVSYLVNRVSSSEHPCEARAAARALVADRPLVGSEEKATELIAVLVASGVLDLSAGRSKGLLFLPAN